MDKAFGVFVADKESGNIELVDCRGFPPALSIHLMDNPPHISDDTHIGWFFRSGKLHETGELANSMPGSTFTNYTFERHDFYMGDEVITVIVGWYW